MPGFTRAAVSIGWDFGNDDDDVSRRPSSTTAQPASGIDYDDDPADIEDNDEDDVAVPPARQAVAFRPAAATGFQAVNRTAVDLGGFSAANTTPFSPSVDTSATTIILGHGQNSSHGNEEDDEDDDSNASGMELEVRTRNDGSEFIKQRKISAEMDLTDQLIVNMKNANHTNENIAAELRKHGLVAYDPKTVGSRFIRLQKKIAEREAQRLEDELTDWHEGEDDALLRADELAQNEIRDIIQRAKNRRWQIVSKNLHKILKKELKYGPKACEKRFVDLMNDCATIPLELDDDPEARRAERAQRVLQKLSERALAEARDKHVREQKRLTSDQNSLRAAMEKSKRFAERAERANKKAEEAKAKALASDQKHKALQQKRAAEEARLLSTAKMYAKSRGIANGLPSPDTPTATSLTPTAPIRTPTVAALAPPPVTVAETQTPSQGPTPATTKRKRTTTPADQQIADSPRNHLSVKELGHLLNVRGLAKSGTKAQMIKRLDANDTVMSTKAIKDKLIVAGMSIEGPREELVQRMIQSEVAGSAWGQKFAGTIASGAVSSSESKSSVTAENQPEPKRAKIGTADVEEGENRRADVDSGVGTSVERESN